MEVSAVLPPQVLVIGSLGEFTEGGAANPEKVTSFEQCRRSIQDVEVIRFDEFYERACFIVEDRKGALDGTRASLVTPGSASSPSSRKTVPPPSRSATGSAPGHDRAALNPRPRPGSSSRPA
jgi:hypothetical protein